MEWINIKDRLPETGERVYLWFPEEFHGLSWIWEKQDTENITINGYRVSHWMSLPPETK